MEIGEPVAAPAPDQPDPKLVDCEWKDCKKTHESKPKYKGGGTVAKSGTYADAWVGANLEPWVRHGPGIDASPGLTALQRLKEYRVETESAAYAVGASQLQHPAYHTQKHHLLSAKLFKSRAKLEHNIKLSGWDINGTPNGACLPTYTIDIVRHDLQAHRGNHPNSLYYDHLDPLLKDLEDMSLNYCKADTAGEATSQQDRLVGALDRLAARTYGQVKAWKWLLRSDAIAERAESRARHTLLTSEH